MMISPDSAILEVQDMSYKKLLAKRDEVLEDIYAFEQGKLPKEAFLIDPSPDAFYQWNLEYLGLLCKLIADKFEDENWK